MSNNASNKMTVFLALFLTAALALGALNTAPRTKKDFPVSTGPQSVIEGTYSNSTSTIDTADTEKTIQRDTLMYNRPAGLSGAAFAVAFGDSAKILNVIMARIVNNQVLAAVAGDTTLAGFAITAAGARSVTLTLTPLVDAYRFIVSYDTTANGVSSPWVVYKVEQQFYDR